MSPLFMDPIIENTEQEESMLLHARHKPVPSPAHEGSIFPFPEADEELRKLWLTYGLKYDLETGLLNTKYFQASLDALIRETDPASSSVALLWLDLLNLRKEFSLWGWTGADALLRHVANELRATALEGSLLSRFSRCFVIAVPYSNSDSGARRRFQSLLTRLSQPVSGTTIAPEFAAGIAIYPADAQTGTDLARFASLAAGIAADQRLRTLISFQPGMNSRAMRDYELEVEIDHGLEQNQLTMAYQPKVDLVTGETLGMEALVRWHHPERGAIAPSEFIPLAERSDLIHRIFELGLRAALKDIQVWSKQGFAPPVVSVNVSPASLRRKDFARSVREIMEEIPIDRVELELEVTESLLLDDEKLFNLRLRQLKAIGVRIAIDDFGTRYTGFDLLKRLPLDVMKIDRCFIAGIHRSAELRSLCRTIISMARHMKLSTVAEGIEEFQELEVLQDIACEAGQGFLFQAPVPSAEFAQFLCDWPQRRLGFPFVNPHELRDVDPLYGIAH